LSLRHDLFSVGTYNLLNADTALYIPRLINSSIKFTARNSIFKVLTVNLQGTVLVHHTEITRNPSIEFGALPDPQDALPSLPVSFASSAVCELFRIGLFLVTCVRRMRERGDVRALGLFGCVVQSLPRLLTMSCVR
jgi:hypothetical protein